MGYAVTYESIDEGVDVEVLVGTGSCLVGTEVVEDGGSTTVECNSCTCTDGALACTLMECTE